MSDKVKYLYYGLWIMHPLLQMGIAAFMLRRGLLKQFKFFFAYILTQLVGFAILFPALCGVVTPPSSTFIGPAMRSV